MWKRDHMGDVRALLEMTSLFDVQHIDPLLIIEFTCCEMRHFGGTDVKT